MTELSILIPARNEMFLKRTVEDILDHIEADTEIVVVLDGAWAEPPLEDHKRVTLVYHPVSVGQRAATNEAARLVRGKWVMKCDAHCSFGQGFDRIMLEDIQPDWTMVPIMRNLWGFNWICPNGHKRYQGPSGPCEECGEPTEHDIVWIAKTNPQSTSYCFDSSPKFKYFGAYKKRPECTGDLTETMSLQGSCWMLSKEKYFELGVCDESWGSWGSQGIEVACKTWLSGGRVIVNHRTYYGHLFRTKSGTDWGFPYKLSGRQVKYAQKCAHDLFFNNRWDQQIHPLSWLIEKFWPVPGWTEEDLAELKKKEAESGSFVCPIPITSIGTAGLPINRIGSISGVSSSIDTISVGGLPGSPTDGTTPGFTGNLVGQGVPVLAMGKPASGIGNTTLTEEHVISVGDDLQVPRIAASAVATSVMQVSLAAGDRANQPSIDKAMKKRRRFANAGQTNQTVSAASIPSPDPAFAERIDIVNDNSGEISVDFQSSQSDGAESLSGAHSSVLCVTRDKTIIPSSSEFVKGGIYYTDCRLDPVIMKACQRQMQKAGIPIISVSLNDPVALGVNIVMDGERGPLMMFKQILTGLEMCSFDIVYLLEHDLLYSPSHFDFTPERDDLFYYNNNLWRVDAESGRALFYYSNHTSQLCARRSLLLEHYRNRVAMVERGGFSRRMGYEPGTHGRKERVDDYGCDTWMSEQPNIDLRHKHNLTPTRWNKNEFRNQKFTEGWTEAGSVPGWGRTAGRMDIILSEAG